MHVSHAHTSQYSVCLHTHYQLWKKSLAPGWQILFMSCTACRCMSKRTFPSKTLGLILMAPEEQSVWFVPHPEVPRSSLVLICWGTHTESVAGCSTELTPSNFKVWTRPPLLFFRSTSSPSMHSLTNPVSWNNLGHTHDSQGSNKHEVCIQKCSQSWY